MKFIAIIIGLLCTSSTLFSQTKYTQGELTMEVTNIVFSPEVGADSTIILQNLNEVISELNVKYVFTPDVFTIIKVNDGILGMDTILIVNDLIKKETYFVNSLGYTKDTLIVPNVEPPFDVKIISKIELDEKLFGLNQVEYSCLVNNKDTVSLVTTNDLILPALSSASQLNFGIQGTLLSMKINMGVATLKYEATSFVPKVTDTKYISTDFSQLQNLTETLENLVGNDDENDTEVEPWVEELEKEYGKYTPHGANNDILIKIGKEGYIDEESVEYITREKIDIDIPYIIGELGPSYSNKINYYSERNPKSILDDFKKWGLNSPSITTILSDTSYWYSLADYEKKYVLQFASIHDALLTETARRQIVNNAKLIRFVPNESNSINEEFIKGNIGIDEWYGQFDNHYPLKQGKSEGIDEIYRIIRNMFDFAFEDISIDVDVKLMENKILIECNNIEYVMMIDDFYEEDYESEYNKKEERYAYKDNIEYNKNFYESIVDKIKQVAADNGLRQGYSVYETEPLVPLGFDEYKYFDLIKRFPSLDHYEKRLYLKKLIKKVYDPFARLNMSFPYHPESTCSVSTFGPGHSIDVSFNVQYVTTENKLKFIEFLKDNSDIYNINVENIKRDSTIIMNTLMEGPQNLIQYLGPIKLTIDKVFPVTPRSEYRKKFNEKNNGLSTAYYNISRVLGDDLNISKFRYDKEAHKEYFFFEGEEYSIDPGEVNMMKFIGKHIKKNKSGKRFYRDNTYSVSEEVYYYLLPEHVGVLRSMLNLSI